MPLPRPEARMRRCLGGCDREFMSKGSGNRICPDCDRKRPGYQPSVHSTEVFVRGTRHRISE